jgi:predicted O-methyltransferase YrrM
MRYEDVSEYVAKLVGKGDDLQVWVGKKSVELREHGVYAIDPTRGRFLELLARLRCPKTVLEIGSGAGYSALWFMKGMGSDGTLDAIEYNQAVAKVLETAVKKAGLEGRIRIHNGPALSVLRDLQGPYDFVFIDADKDEYPDYLDVAIRLTQRGSMIIADNMLWGGAMVRGDKRREGARGIMAFTRRIFNDERLSSLIIPLGDGLAISYRVK